MSAELRIREIDDCPGPEKTALSCPEKYDSTAGTANANVRIAYKGSA